MTVLIHRTNTYLHKKQYSQKEIKGRLERTSSTSSFLVAVSPQIADTIKKNRTYNHVYKSTVLRRLINIATAPAYDVMVYTATAMCTKQYKSFLWIFSYFSVFEKISKQDIHVFFIMYKICEGKIKILLHILFTNESHVFNLLLRI